MVHPTLWGPTTWQILFGCAWNCPDAKIDVLRRVAVDLVPALLPCLQCRAHARRLRRPGALGTAHDVLRWLHAYKRDVGRRQKHSVSLSFDDLTRRLAFTGGVVDDVAAADCLVLFALAAEELDDGRAKFVALCTALAEVLPSAGDSELRAHLCRVRPETIVLDSVRAARAARIERGLPVPQSSQHYRNVYGEG